MLKLATLGAAYCVCALFITFTNSNVITNIVPAVNTNLVIKHDNPLWANPTNMAPAENRKLKLYKIYKNIKKLNPLKKKKALKFIVKNLPNLVKTFQPKKKKAYKKRKKKDLKKCVPIGFLKELEKASTIDEEYDYDDDFMEDEDFDYLEQSGSRHNSFYRPPFPPIPIFHQHRRILLDASLEKQPDKHKPSPLFIVLAKLLHSSSIQPKAQGVIVKQPISTIGNLRNKPTKVMTPTAVKYTHVNNGGLLVRHHNSKRVIPVKEIQNDVMVIHGPYPNLTRIGVVKNRITLPRLVLFKPGEQSSDDQNSAAVKPSFHISYGKKYYDLSKRNHTSGFIRFGAEDGIDSEIINNNKLTSPEGNALSQNYNTKIMPTGMNRVTNKNEQQSEINLIFDRTTENPNLLPPTSTEANYLFGGTTHKAKQFYTSVIYNHKQNVINGSFSGFSDNSLDRKPNNSFQMFPTTESYFSNHEYFVTPQSENNAFLPTRIPEETVYISQQFSSGGAYQNQGVKLGENQNQALPNTSNKPLENDHINFSDARDIYKVVLPTPITKVVQRPKTEIHENRASFPTFKKLFYPNINFSFELPTNTLQNNMVSVNIDKNRMNILKKLAVKINDNIRNAGRVSIPKVILPSSNSDFTKSNNFMGSSSYNPSDRFRIGKEVELRNDVITTEKSYNFSRAYLTNTEQAFNFSRMDLTTPTVETEIPYRVTENDSQIVEFVGLKSATNVYDATKNISELVDYSANITTLSTEYGNRENVNNTHSTSTRSNIIQLYSVTENVIEIKNSK